jgi:hypothetical protein
MTQADSRRILLRVPARNFARSIVALVIYEDIFPVLISLVQDAFDALRKEVPRIMEGRNDADEG